MDGRDCFFRSLILASYLVRGAIPDVFERFCRSRLYHRVVDQDALNDLLKELDGDTEDGSEV